jgi:hypothetical protein
MSGEQIFEEMLGDIHCEKELYKFKARVGVVKMRAPRHEFFEFIRDMGQPDIDKVFTGKSFGGKKVLTFVFPERWMGVHEQRSFTSALEKHPEVDSITQVDIITSSPMIVGSFYAEQILILTWADDEKHNGEV